MFKFSHIISLPVINVYNTRIEGIVENIFINNKMQVTYLIVYDDNTDSYKTLSLRDIFSISESAIYIKNSSKITLYENNDLKIRECHNPINSPAYMIGENYVGRINDIVFEKNGCIKNIYINNASISPSKILTFKNSLTLLKSERYHKLNQFNYRPVNITKLITHSTEPVVNILSTPAPLPQREMTNYTFLLNRQILKNIKNYNGEVLAKQNTLVTQAVVDKLKRYGKLKELMLNSK